MKANIVKELQHGIKKRKAENAKNPIVNEINKLLEYDAARDNQVLDMIAPNSTLSKSKNEMSAVVELEAKEDFYAGEVFTKEQIINLAVKYRLKFLPSVHYNAYIDPKIVLDIRELERNISESMLKQQAAKRNLSIDDYLREAEAPKIQLDASQLKNKFFILAPASCFKTKKTKFITIVQDPIMFYTDDNKHFRLIRKWGSDFTVFRRFLGFITKSIFRHILLLYIVPLIAGTLFLCIKYDWMFSLIFVAALIACIVIFGPADAEIDNDFQGEKYVTSEKSFYM